MATLVDSNIFLDILQPGSQWAGWSENALLGARRIGPLLYNVVIASEVAYSFRTEQEFMSFFDGLPIQSAAIPEVAAYRAAVAHRIYRGTGGQRERTLPDFLIGAHADVESHKVLTRDPSGYRAYFPTVEIIAPDTHP